MKKKKTGLTGMVMRLLVMILMLLSPLAGTGRAALVDNGNGTVTDTATCLQWQQASMDRTGDGIRDSMTWEQALYESEHLTLAGYSDWRLPDINELTSIVDYSRYSPAIDTALFPDTVSSYYWSSTTYAYNTYFAWRVYFGYGYDSRSHKSSSYYVRAVRGGQCGAFGYFGRIHQAPMEGPPGTTFTQSGWAFTPNSTVTLYFRNQQGEPLPSLQWSTNASGAFTIDYTAPPDKPVGTHTWWAVDDTSGRMSEPLGYLITGATGQETPVTTGTVSENLGPIQENYGFGELTSEGDFYPDKETFVIVHGWNPTDSNELPPWVKSMGIIIKNDGRSPANGSNVLYWNWQEEAKESYGRGVTDPSCDKKVEGLAEFFKDVPFDKTSNSGSYLAAALLKVLSKTYDQNIHFIGHSLGTLVSTYAAKFAKDRNLHYADKIKHLVFLDSPCKGKGNLPAGTFLSDNRDIFIDDYISSPFGTAYDVADVNVWLTKTSEWLIDDAHSYAHIWYQDSVINFQDHILDPSPPPSTMPWGFYWQDETTHSDAASSYYQRIIVTEPHYYLNEGEPDSQERRIDGLVNKNIFLQDATNEIINQIENYAEWTQNIVTILAANTYNTAADIAGYVTDLAGHAMYNSLGYLTLLHSSTAVLSMPVDIPAGANALAFGYEFLYGESGSMLEVFINDVPVFHTTSGLALGEGLQLIPWINVESFAGQSATLTLRISNPNPDTEGKILIDDLVIAKIEEAKSIFPWTMFLPAIIGGQQ